MNKKMRLIIFFAAIFTILSVGVLAADTIYPDSVTGEYCYFYDTGVANEDFIVVVVSGIYEQGYVPEISAESVLYYNVFASDENGILEVRFVPFSYGDATVFVGGYDFSESVVACYAMQGEAKDVSDFSLMLSEDSVTVDGENGGAIRVSTHATDSFGFDTVLPDYTVYEIVGYTGNDIAVSKNGVISIGATAKAGIYTLRVTCKDVVREKVFTVNRAASVTKRIVLACNGNSWYTHYVECVNTADGFSFAPVSCEITVVAYDQYGDEISENFNFKYAEVYANNIVGDMTLFASGESAHFIPPEKVMVGERDLQYKIQVSPTTDSALKQELLIVVQGDTLYTGKTFALYESYLEAKSYVEMIDNGSIVASNDGFDVYYQNSWVKEGIMSDFIAVTEDVSALFTKIDTSGASSEEISNALSLLTKELSSFSGSLRKGLFAPLETIEFKQDSVKISIGETICPEIEIFPVRHTEDVVYSSGDQDVAVVSDTGTITAIGEGQTYITASNTDGTVIDILKVVVYKPITNIAWELNSINLVAGQVLTPVLQTAPGIHSDVVSFYTSDDNVVTVDENGTVRAVSAGEANVTAQTLAGKNSVLRITVSQPKIAVPEEMRVKQQNSFTLPLKIENSFGISALTVKVKFNKNKLTYISATESDLFETASFESIVTPGEIICAWDISDASNKSGELLKYTFSTGENTPYSTYKIEYEFIATTFDGQNIVLKSSSGETGVVVGEDDKYSVTVQAQSGGKVQGSAQYLYGERAIVTAISNDGFTFAGWYIDQEKVSDNATYKFEVVGDITLVAKFSRELMGPTGTPVPTPTDDENEKNAVVSAVVPNVLSASYVEYGSQIILSCATKDATIYYTLDGTVPSDLSIKYTGPIIVESDMTIKAVAIKDGMENSIVSTFTYVCSLTETVEISVKKNADSVKYIVPVNSRVRPDEPASRYEVVEMLDKLFDVKGKTAMSVKFSDIDLRFKAIIDKYSGAQIINGYPDGTFGGTNGITRAEVSKILYNMLEFDFSSVSGYSVSLTDIQEHWAEHYIKTCVTTGIFIGYPDGTFGPERLVTRAEMITIINRITGVAKIPGIISDSVTDVPAQHWAYDDIMNVIRL